MNSINAIVFRYLTDADFFNINKPAGTEKGGGGQSYIDFPTTDIGIPSWEYFFKDIAELQVSETGAGRPEWSFPIYSIGLPREMSQTLKVYQRREASVAIAAQKLDSIRSNRVWAWKPTCGFPVPEDPNDLHKHPPGLAVYLVKTNNCEVWAGWFQNSQVEENNQPKNISILPSSDKVVLGYLTNIFRKDRPDGYAGICFCDNDKLMLNEDAPNEAFSPLNDLESSMVAPTSQKDLILSGGTETKTGTKKKTATKITESKVTYSQIERSEKEIIDSLFSEDSNYTNSGNETIIEKHTRVRKRNHRAVADLKKLYEHKCQISDTEYLFRKKDGTYYTESSPSNATWRRRCR